MSDEPTISQLDHEGTMGYTYEYCGEFYDIFITKKRVPWGKLFWMCDSHGTYVGSLYRSERGIGYVETEGSPEYHHLHEVFYNLADRIIGSRWPKRARRPAPASYGHVPRAPVPAPAPYVEDDHD